MKKRLVAFLLTALMLITPVYSAEVNSNFADRIVKIKFADMEALPATHWSSQAVYTMSALGVIKGDNNMFRPTGTATRSEALAVLMRSAGLEQTAEFARKNAEDLKKSNPYRYNKIDEWADGYIRLAVDFKILTIEQYNQVMSIEYEHNPSFKTFVKEGEVTRAEVAEWFVKIFKIPLKEKENLITDFTDCSHLSKQTRLYLETALSHGILKGDGNGIRPDGTISRQELAQILYNARQLVCEKNNISVENAKISDVMTDTISATEVQMVNRTEMLLDSGKSYTLTRTYSLSGAGVDYNILHKTDTDILTVKEGQAPGGAHLLNTGDSVEIYSDEKGTPFLIVSNKVKSEATEILDDSYIEGSYVYGKLYLIDESQKMLVVKTGADSYEEIPYLDGMEAFWRQEKIEKERFMLEFLDLPCIVFRAKSESGTIYRAYRIQFLESAK